MAVQAEDVFAEQNLPEKLLNLRLAWYLFEMIHILHIRGRVPFDLDYPYKKP